MGAMKQGPCACTTFQSFVAIAIVFARTNVPLSSARTCIVFVWSQFDGGKIDNRTI